MDTLTAVLLVAAVGVVTTQQYHRHTPGDQASSHYHRHTQGHQASPHYHEFDYRRFGGYPVHMGNGHFSFLGGSSHRATHTALKRRPENVAEARHNNYNGQNYYPQKPSRPQENTNYQRQPVLKPSDVRPQKGLPYSKVILSPGDGTRFPQKGDTVEVWYTGKLTNGEIFDSNLPDQSKGAATEAKPLKFPVGTGLVIRGWDESLLTMSLGESARVTIQPEWAYGKKGAAGGKIPPNAVLVFEMQLAAIH